MTALTRILFLLMMWALPVTLITGFGPFRVYTLDVFLVPLIFAFIIAKLTNPRIRIRFSGPDKYVLLLFFFIIVSFVLSGDRFLSKPNLIDWFRYLFIYMISRSLFESEVIKSKEFVNTLTWIGVVLMLVGLIQAITNTRFGLIGNFFGASLNQGSTAGIAWNQVVSRVSGTSPNPNVYSMWITIFFGLALARAFVGGRYYLFFFGVALGSFAIVSTLARGGVAAFFLFVAIMLLMNYKKLADNRYVFSLAAATLAAIVIAVIGAYVTEIRFEQILDSFMARVDQASDKKSAAAASGRIDLILMGFDVIFSNAKVLFFGTGASSFTNGIIIHNMWMRLFAEHGVFALLALVTLFLSFFRIIKKFRSGYTEESRFWVTYLTATLIPYFLISSQVYHTAGSYDVIIPLFVIISFVVSRQRIAEKNVVAPNGELGREAASVVPADRIIRRRPRLLHKP